MNEILKILDTLSTYESKKKYLTEFIIPAMDKMEGRKHMGDADVAAKTWSHPVSDKHEEERESDQTINKSGERELLSTDTALDVALKIAEIMYYHLQPNAPEKEDFYRFGIFIFLIFGEISPYDLAIVKYLARLEHGDLPNYHEAEKREMLKFFKQIDFQTR